MLQRADHNRTSCQVKWVAEENHHTHLHEVVDEWYEEIVLNGAMGQKHDSQYSGIHCDLAEESRESGE